MNLVKVGIFCASGTFIIGTMYLGLMIHEMYAHKPTWWVWSIVPIVAYFVTVMIAQDVWKNRNEDWFIGKS